MPRVAFTVPAEAAASQGWTLLSVFAHIADRHPDIRDNRIENGLPETPPRSPPSSESSERRNHREALLAFGPAPMRLSYPFTLSSLP